MSTRQFDRVKLCFVFACFLTALLACSRPAQAQYSHSETYTGSVSITGDGGWGVTVNGTLYQQPTTVPISGKVQTIIAAVQSSRGLLCRASALMQLNVVINITGPAKSQPYTVTVVTSVDAYAEAHVNAVSGDIAGASVSNMGAFATATLTDPNPTPQTYTDVLTGQATIGTDGKGTLTVTLSNSAIANAQASTRMPTTASGTAKITDIRVQVTGP